MTILTPIDIFEDVISKDGTLRRDYYLNKPAAIQTEEDELTAVAYDQYLTD